MKNCFVVRGSSMRKRDVDRKTKPIGEIFSILAMVPETSDVAARLSPTYLNLYRMNSGTRKVIVCLKRVNEDFYTRNKTCKSYFSSPYITSARFMHNFSSLDDDFYENNASRSNAGCPFPNKISAPNSPSCMAIFNNTSPNKLFPHPNHSLPNPLPSATPTSKFS